MRRDIRGQLEQRVQLRFTMLELEQLSNELEQQHRWARRVCLHFNTVLPQLRLGRQASQHVVSRYCPPAGNTLLGLA